MEGPEGTTILDQAVARMDAVGVSANYSNRWPILGDYAFGAPEISFRPLQLE
jgi:hypothetical protein